MAGETILSVLYLLVGGAVALFLDLFTLTSVREGKRRAALLGAFLFVAFSAAWFGTFLILDPPPPALAAGALAVGAFALFFFLPVGRPNPVRVGEVGERVDQRDTLFAREGYRPGTVKYEAYYARQPERKAVDDKIRKLPELLGPGGRYYEPNRARHISRIFQVNESLTTRVDGPVAKERAEVDPAELTRAVKDLAKKLGADDVGVAELDPMWVYSHVGRGPEPWGEPIENRHRYAVAIVLEMGYESVEQAPRLPLTEETAAKYLKGAEITVALAEYVRTLGYPARAHIAGSNYQIMLPPVAQDAGLGELGRMGYLIHPRYGARFRLGAITTDLPLVPDGPIVFGVQEFCEKCRKCATSCPSGAIPKGGKTEVRGVEKWPLDIERCFHYWRVIGTDCGLCMKSCPYSHPPALVHDVVRLAIRRSPFARTVAVLGDDLFYGSRVR